MYHSNNPRVVEIPDDVDHVESMSYIPGEIPCVTVTFVLKPGKTYNNPSMLFATNGVESRLFAPTITLAERVADEPTQALTLPGSVLREMLSPVETPQIESQPQEEAKVETPKKSRKKASDGGGEV